jgi:hypothetical protein
VNNASTVENSNEKTSTIHNLMAKSWMKYKTITATDGKIVEMTTAITLAVE